jgi:large repetitive protein
MQGRKFLYSAAGVFAVAGVLLLAGPAGAARQIHAANPTCGSTVAVDVTLSADLICPSTTGLVIGASGITINLNGFTLNGELDTNSSNYGIDNTSGYNNVTVEDGTITGFYEDIYSDSANSFTATGLTLLNGVDSGFFAEYDTNDVVTGSTAKYNAYGIYFEYGADNSASGNVVSQSGQEGITLDEETASSMSSNYSQFTAGEGIDVYDYYSNLDTVSGNIATAGKYGVYLYDYGYGSVTVVNNGARAATVDGFTSEANFLSAYGDWLGAQAPYSTFSGNQSIYNASDGFDSEYDWYTTWTNNFASRNGGYGFNVDDPLGETLTGNTANYNGVDGFYIEDNLTDGSDSGNVSDFSSNTAKYNQGYGFDADYGVPGSGNAGSSSNNGGDCYLVAGCS